jgi:hypothetical protein
VDKQKVCTYNQTVANLRKEEDPDTCYNMNKLEGIVLSELKHKRRFLEWSNS